MPPIQHNISPEEKGVKKQAPQASQPTLAPNATPIVQREGMDVSRLSPGQVMSLQRSMGNRAVQNLLSSRSAPVIQTKLEVGPAGDRFEQEADRIAAQVVNTSSTANPPLQREEEPNAIQRDDLEEDELEGSE